MELDLNECLADWINKHTGIPIKVDYLAPDNQVGMIPNPGSHMVSEDFDGLQYWQYNYAVSLSTKSSREANEKLQKIAGCLMQLERQPDLKSENGSWVFDRIEVNSAPAMTLKDVQGTAIYQIDMAVFIYVQN